MAGRHLLTFRFFCRAFFLVDATTYDQVLVLVEVHGLGFHLLRDWIEEEIILPAFAMRLDDGQAFLDEEIAGAIFRIDQVLAYQGRVLSLIHI